MIRPIFLLSICIFAADSRKPSASITRKGGATIEATGGISAPVLGYVTNDARTELRAMLGVPSSSELSETLDFHAALRRVYPAPGNEKALAETADGLVAVSLTSGESVQVSSISKIDRLAFSPSGRFALVQTGEEPRLFVVSLDGRTQPREVLAPPMRLSVLAVDDSGTIAIGSGEDGSIYVLPTREDGQASRAIYRALSVSDMAFLPGTATLVIADSERGAVLVVGDPAGSPSIRLIAEGLPQEPMLIAGAMRNGEVFGVLTKSSMAFRIGVADGAIEWLQMPIRPVVLQRVRNGNSFLVSAQEGEPAWLLSETPPAGMQVTFSVRKAAASKEQGQ